MTKFIALSDGHGISTAGKRTPTLPNGQKSEIGLPYMNENLFNRAVVRYLDAELRRHGFKTLLVAPGDADVPLETRTALADKNKVDLYVSVHANAFKSVWGSHGGIETFTYKLTGESYRIGKLIHSELIKGSPLKDRGVKDGSHLWEIRKPIAPSVLVECGFMDSSNDYKYLLSDTYRKECAVEIAKGICKAYGVTYKAEVAPKPTAPKPTSTPKKTTTYYRVIVGSYANKANGITQINNLKKKGFESFLADYTVEKKVLWRVVAGSYSKRESATAQMTALKKAGFESFILPYEK